MQVVGSLAEALPFIDEAFDGIVGLNVLHHVPDVAQVTLELAQGATARWPRGVLEPGLEHLDAPETRRAIAEHGENDQPFDVLAFLAELARWASRARASRRRFSRRSVWFRSRRLSCSRRASITIRRSPNAAFSTKSTGATRLRCSSGKARGSEPRGFLASCGERFEVEGIPARLVRGKTYRATARVKNTGDTRWLAEKDPMGGFVTVGCKFANEAGRVVCDTAGPDVSAFRRAPKRRCHRRD